MDYKASGGLYYEAGLGYKFIWKNKITIGFSAGYSFKHQKETYGTTLLIEAPIFPQPYYYNPPVNSYDYKFRRISIKFNCSFYKHWAIFYIHSNKSYCISNRNTLDSDNFLSGSAYFMLFRERQEQQIRFNPEDNKWNHPGK